MDAVYSFDHTVDYFQVDHTHRLQLNALFQLFQEAAIRHANQYEIGTGIMETKAESWILNRVAMQLGRYPKFQETITVQTWAARLKQFKGFREFRLISGGEVIGKASTLWLYISLKKKAFTHMPFETEKNFPVNPDDVHVENLDRLRLPKPAEGARTTSVSLRYSDIDGNQHVNNAAYMDMLQTGLHHQHLETHPRAIGIHFAREISPDAQAVDVRLEPAKAQTIFSLESDGQIAAFGRME